MPAFCGSVGVAVDWNFGVFVGVFDLVETTGFGAGYESGGYSWHLYHLFNNTCFITWVVSYIRVTIVVGIF